MNIIHSLPTVDKLAYNYLLPLVKVKLPKAAQSIASLFGEVQTQQGRVKLEAGLDTITKILYNAIVCLARD